MQICHLGVIPCIFRGFDFASGIHYLTHSHTFLSFSPVMSLLSLWPLGWLFISNGYLFWDSHICQAHTSCQYHTTVLWMGRIPKCYSPPPISIPCLLLLIQHPGFPFQYLSSFIPSPLASPLSNCYKPAMHGIPFLSFCVGITPTSGLFCNVQTTPLHLTASEMWSLYSISCLHLSKHHRESPDDEYLQGSACFLFRSSLTTKNNTVS